MDLLHYGSSSSEEDEGEDNSGHDNKSNTKAAAAPTKSILKNKTTLPPPLPHKATPATSTTTTNKTTKGKRILSLQSVLPAHILEQLTKSQVRGDALNTNTNDDDDDDDWEPPASSSKAPPSFKATNRNSSNDAGIDSFLSELHQSAPATTITNNKSSRPTTAAPPAPLGAAFLSTTTVVTTTTKGQPGMVRDIHGENFLSTKRDETEEPTFMSKQSTTTSSVLRAAPRHSVPRPSTTKNSPLTAPAANAAATTIANPTTTANILHSGMKSTDNNDNNDNNANAAVPPNSNKRRRQEMERLLRQGQLDAALDASNTSNANITAMEQPVSLGPTDGASLPVDTTGLVHMKATPMYDPKQGTAVLSSGGGAPGRGKNQINHLLASAANLELARARGMVPHATHGQNSHRANAKRKYAKRKYGW